MPNRLNAIDTSFLHSEGVTTPMHVGSVMVFDPPEGGFDHDRLVALISRRIAFVPRYRQRVREVPAHLANPAWVDDERFDITYHVRRSALPKPGTDEQLEELVARILPRPLDRNRPLWEVYLVEGLSGGRFAIISKTHHALVDGINAVDIGHVLVDGGQGDDAAIPDSALTWRPSKEPTDAELVVAALSDSIRTPTEVVETFRTSVSDLRATVDRLSSATQELIHTVARLSRPAPTSPLNGSVGRARRFVMVGTDLEDYRRIRARVTQGRSSEPITVNDVVLATIAGAFRSWLLTRGESIHPGTTVRALVPVSVHSSVGQEAEAEDTGRELVPCFVDLPVGEPGASMRLHQIAFIMRQQVESGRPMSAEQLSTLGGFASPTIHALGARLAGRAAARLYNVAVTNVPGPQHPLFSGGAKMVSTYPVMPLHPGQTLSIGLTSYDGGVYFGLYSDRDALPDLDVLGTAIVDSLSELREAPRRRSRAR